MPSRGFITAASGEEYVRMAYALALSIKATQKDNTGLTVIVDDLSHVLPHYHAVFENIVVVGDEHHSSSSMEPRSKFYDLSPYDSTICLDADMVLLSDHSELWAQLERQEITWALAYTFADEKITNRAYRLDFDAANLPDAYSAFFFFKKGQVASCFFDTVKDIFENWKEWRFKFMKPPMCFKRKISTDVAFAIAAKAQNIVPAFYPKFVHYKQLLQTPENVKLPMYLAPGGSMFVGRYRQHLPFHYYDKNLTEPLIEWLGGY